MSWYLSGLSFKLGNSCISCGLFSRGHGKRVFILQRKVVRIISGKDYGDDVKSKFIDLNIWRGSEVELTRERIGKGWKKNYAGCVWKSERRWSTCWKNAQKWKKDDRVEKKYCVRMREELSKWRRYGRGGCWIIVQLRSMLWCIVHYYHTFS